MVKNIWILEYSSQHYTILHFNYCCDATQETYNLTTFVWFNSRMVHFFVHFYDSCGMQLKKYAIWLFCRIQLKKCAIQLLFWNLTQEICKRTIFTGCNNITLWDLTQDQGTGSHVGSVSRINYFCIPWHKYKFLSIF